MRLTKFITRFASMLGFAVIIAVIYTAITIKWQLLFFLIHGIGILWLISIPFMSPAVLGRISYKQFGKENIIGFKRMLKFAYGRSSEPDWR